MTTAVDMDVCSHCEGAGAYWDDQTGQPDEPYGGRMITCHVCGGEGIVDTSPCIACGAPSYDHDDTCPVGATGACTRCSEPLNVGRDGISDGAGGQMHWRHHNEEVRG